MESEGEAPQKQEKKHCSHHDWAFIEHIECPDYPKGRMVWVCRECGKRTVTLNIAGKKSPLASGWRVKITN
jgi:hypothetical protein